MKRLYKWFSKPLILTEKEQKILLACNLILSREDRDIKVNPFDMSYLIHSTKLSYFLHVNSSSIAFTNHNHFDSKPYREDFIDLIKDTIKKQTIIDRNLLLEEISQNENDLIDRMIENLKKPV